MTRKDFELVADAINSLNFTRENKLFIAQRFADVFATEFEKFDRFIFIKAAMQEQ